MKILLVQPNLNPAMRGIREHYILEPLGLQFIASAVSDHEVVMADLRVDEMSIQDYIEAFRPHIVGISCTIVDVPETLSIARSVRVMLPDTKVVVGGMFSTVAPEYFVRDCVDFIVRGEGEVPFSTLVRQLDGGDVKCGEVPGVIRVVNGKLTDNYQDPVYTPASAIPTPVHGAFQPCAHFSLGAATPNRTDSLLSTSVARGCRHRCIFCTLRKGGKGRIRHRDIMDVVIEIGSSGASYVNIVDENLFAEPVWAEALSRALQHICNGVRYRISADVRSILDHFEVMRSWREAGASTIGVGLESHRAEDLLFYKKPHSVDQGQRACKKLRSLGLDILGHFIVHPDFTRKDFVDLAEYVTACGVTLPIFTVLTPVPGSRLFELWHDRITATRWADFDFMHLVVPSSLPEDEFMHELASLYARFYDDRPASDNPFAPVAPGDSRKLLQQDLRPLAREETEIARLKAGASHLAISRL